jgi:hypothetical protein
MYDAERDECMVRLAIVSTYIHTISYNPINPPTHPRIFIINGAMTMRLAVLDHILILDFPTNSKNHACMPFLAPHEVTAIQAKLERDRHDSSYDALTWPKFLQACLRWDLYLFARSSSP